MTQQKRKDRKYKKRGAKRFSHKPDRTLNEKKKRRASAQKADTSRESEQKQPFMIEMPLKAADDEPMEVDQIHQDEAETDLIDYVDQPLDYEIDEYLDDPSKHSLFTYIHNSIENHQEDFPELAKVSGDEDEGGDDDAEDGDPDSESDSD